MNNIYLGLVHYPVNNKDFDVVTTSITNLDIHDIARSCTTFGIKNYFIINPYESQQKMLDKVLGFWRTEIAEKYNIHRVQALSIVKYAESIDSCREYIKKQEGVYPKIITTTARVYNGQIDPRQVREIGHPILLLFGTGNGLTKEVHKEADNILKPIQGMGEYNHLSVRSAIAIVLDRLTSEK